MLTELLWSRLDLCWFNPEVPKCREIRASQDICGQMPIDRKLRVGSNDGGKLDQRGVGEAGADAKELVLTWQNEPEALDARGFEGGLP